MGAHVQLEDGHSGTVGNGLAAPLWWVYRRDVEVRDLSARHDGLDIRFVENDIVKMY